MTDRRLLRLALPAALAALLIAALPLGAATITIVNTDGPGEGFNDPTAASPVGGNSGTTLGEQRLIAFQAAADTWGAIIESEVEIFVQASFDPLDCDAGGAVLGAAGAIQIVSNFPNAPLADTWYHIALANALAGQDLIPGPTDSSADDIIAFFNSDIDNNNNCLSGINWYLGLDHNPGNDIDLLVVLLHEFAHGLGFSSFVDETTGREIGPPFRPDVYGHSTLDLSTGLHWDEMSNGQRKSSAVNDGNVVWDGANVTAEVGLLSGGTNGGFAQLYAPNPVEPGSSISHWDPAASPNQLMEPFINDGLDSDFDDYLSDELMVDVGWTRVAQPAVCGNDVREAGEECDGNDLGGETCGGLLGCIGGTLTCDGNCEFDTSLCTGSNGIREGSEECDGMDFGSLTCSDFECGGGNLSCDADCTVDPSTCTDCCVANGNSCQNDGDCCSLNCSNGPPASRVCQP